MKKTKKEIKINMSKLSIGGMEKALVDLLNNSDLLKNYNVTLLLVYNNQKNYLKILPDEINVKILWNGKWNLIGKIVAGCKLIKETLLPKKYFASICYTHHHSVLSRLTRRESENSIIFIHADLINSRSKSELYSLCKKVKFNRFKKVICVSEKAKNSFIKVYPKYEGKIYVANNYIDGELIIKNSKECITDLKKDKIITFINVARHEEECKKISRIIKAVKKLNDKNYKFRVLLIGDGEDNILYKEMVKKYNLDNVFLLGAKDNPFPYYKISDAFLFASKYEGYGIVLNEARVLNIPIITTDVADAKLITDDGYGILCENSDNGVYLGMKKYLDEGYKIKNKFDYKKFNEKITKTINTAIEE